jgi:hypothetical protein
MEARVTAYSQAHQLRERMQRAEVQHGQEIRADLPGIKVSAAVSAWLGVRQGGKGEVFFCNMGPIRVRKVTIAGDGRRLPDEAIVRGLNVADDGTYDLLNALVRSNGNLQIIVDEVTQVVRTPGTREFAGATG